MQGGAQTSLEADAAKGQSPWDVMIELPDGIFPVSSTLLRRRYEHTPDYMDLRGALAAEIGAEECFGPGWECTLDGITLSNQNTNAALTAVGGRRVVIRVVPGELHVLQRLRELKAESAGARLKEEKDELQEFEGERSARHADTCRKREAEEHTADGCKKAKTQEPMERRWQRLIEDERRAREKAESEAKHWHKEVEKLQELQERWQKRYAEESRWRCSAEEEVMKWRNYADPAELIETVLDRQREVEEQKINNLMHLKCLHFWGASSWLGMLTSSRTPTLEENITILPDACMHAPPQEEYSCQPSSHRQIASAIALGWKPSQRGLLTPYQRYALECPVVGLAPCQIELRLIQPYSSII